MFKVFIHFHSYKTKQNLCGLLQNSGSPFYDSDIVFISTPAFSDDNSHVKLQYKGRCTYFVML